MLVEYTGLIAHVHKRIIIQICYSRNLPLIVKCPITYVNPQALYIVIDAVSIDVTSNTHQQHIPMLTGLFTAHIRRHNSPVLHL